jgi:hypothetical protein
MSNKEKIEKLEKEITIINKTLIVFLIAGIVELILTIRGYIRFDFLSLGIMLACFFMFVRYVKKRNVKDVMVKIYDIMELTEEEYQTKYKNK